MSLKSKVENLNKFVSRREAELELQTEDEIKTREQIKKILGDKQSLKEAEEKLTKQIKKDKKKIAKEIESLETECGKFNE